MQKSCGYCGQPFQAKRVAARWCSERCKKRAQRDPDRMKAQDGPDGARPRPYGLPSAAEGANPGPVERKVREDIAAMVTSHPMGEALSEMSYALARLLDTGAGAGVSVAAVNHELRENLAELSRLAVDDSDELADELSAPELPPEIRDAPES